MTCELTTEELGAHHRAIEKIKRKLFERHTEADYGIVPGSIKSIQPMTSGYGSSRRISYGGLEFLVGPREKPKGHISIKHCEASLFLLHLIKLDQGQPFTRLAITFPFGSLDEQVLESARIGLGNSAFTKW